MSDGQATADRELSTSDTAVPTVGDKTHVLEAPAATIVQGESTRRNQSAAARTIVAPHEGEFDGASPQAQTIVAPAGDVPTNGNGNGYTYGATVVADGELPGDDANGFQMGATVVPGEDPHARATRAAEVLSSFDASQQAGECEIAPGESVIGRFRILKTLGEGSFGAVYLAEDPQLDRRVAIKVTKVGVLTTRSDVDRFQREAKAAAQLRHPNIVPVYEVGRIGRSSFLAYEFIDGRTLGSHLKEEKKLPPRDAAQIMFAIAGALGYAHELGIIHRDMKPDNVLLDKQGQPHIADFGLARRDSGEMDKTREGGLMGTPLYMSPEQASGRSHEADARADVWSLGVMLREMLTGVLPFTGKLTEILIGIQTVEPPKIRSLDKKLPKDLETICQKCLSKDPAQRYANGTELAAELDRYLRGDPILARPLSVPARVVRWVKRNPKGAGVMALLLSAAIVSTWLLVALKQTQKQNWLEKLSLLTSSQPNLVPSSIADLGAGKDVIATPLRQRLSSSELAPPPRNRLRLALATLFPETAEQELSFDAIAETLVQMPADELQMQVRLLAEGRFHGQAVPKLTEIAHDKSRELIERRQALYALATLDPSLPSWETDAADTAAGMVATNIKDLPAILQLIKPIRDRIAIELERLFDDPKVGDDAANVLALMYEDQPQKLYSFVQKATPRQLQPLIEGMRSSDSNLEVVAQAAHSDISGVVAGQAVPESELVARCNAFLVLYGVAPQAVDWRLLAGGADNTLRTEIIQRMPDAVPQWNAAAEQLRIESDPAVRQALLLALQQYSTTDLVPEQLAELLPSIAQLYESDPSPAVHTAARQFLERKGGSAALQIQRTPVPLEEREERNWFRNSHGQEFAVINGPVQFLMGASSDDSEQDNRGIERRHLRRIPRSFAIAMREVTVHDFLQFEPTQYHDPGTSSEPTSPMTDMSWVDAAKYCRWLSEQEGIPEEEMCFPPIDQITVDVQLPPDVLLRTGYRLPTAAEWEFACRAGTTTSRWIGSRDQLLVCAWFRENSGEKSHAVGMRAPNLLGLEDTLGNVLEYCQDFYFDDYPVAEDGQPVVDGADKRDGYSRELRGGSYGSVPASVRASQREVAEYADTPWSEAGFRLARTIRNETPPATASK